MEENFAVKMVVTNSRNEARSIIWFFATKEKDVSSWVKEQEAEEVKWNYHTDGAVSTRYYDFEYYSKDGIMDARIDDLEGLTLRQIAEIINQKSQ